MDTYTIWLEIGPDEINGSLLVVKNSPGPNLICPDEFKTVWTQKKIVLTYLATTVWYSRNCEIWITILHEKEARKELWDWCTKSNKHILSAGRKRQLDWLLTRRHHAYNHANDSKPFNHTRAPCK